MKRRQLLFSLPAVPAVLLTGCGSGKRNSSGGSRLGRARFTIRWPDRETRLIPIAANSIRVALTGPANIERLVGRPPEGQNTTEVTVTDIPFGTYSLAATALPNADGSGTVQAAGSMVVTVQGTDTVHVKLTMATTITEIQFYGDSYTLYSGDKASVRVFAKDAQGALVLTAPTNWEWSSSNPGIVAFTDAPQPNSPYQSRMAEAKTIGEAFLLVRESQSGINATIPCQVIARPKGWLQVRGDIRNTGCGIGPGVTPTVRWKTNIGSFPGFFNAAVVAPDGTIYVVNYLHEVCAVSPQGVLKWRIPTIDTVGTHSTPVLDALGNIYFAFPTGPTCEVFSFAPDGTKRWQKSIPGGGSIINQQMSTDGKETIYVGTSDSYLHAYSLDGTFLWKTLTFPFSTSNSNPPTAPAIGPDGTLYSVTTGRNLMALTPEGNIKWNISPGEGQFIWNLAVGRDGLVYVTILNDIIQRQGVAAVNSQGVFVWRMDVPHYCNQGPALAPDGTIIVAERTSNNTGPNPGKVSAVVPGSGVIWTITLGKELYDPVVASDGTIYIAESHSSSAAENTNLHAISPAGNLLWTFTGPQTFWDMTPALGTDGTIYVANRDNNLYALR